MFLRLGGKRAPSYPYALPVPLALVDVLDMASGLYPYALPYALCLVDVRLILRGFLEKRDSSSEAGDAGPGTPGWLDERCSATRSGCEANPEEPASDWK
jgi:hypothetical protein